MDGFMAVLWFLFPLTLLSAMMRLVSKRVNKHNPPGPTPLPIIGNLHLVGNLPNQSLAKLAKTHGPLMSLKFGQVTTIVISSSAIAKEAIQKQDLNFSSRSVPDGITALDHHDYSVVWLPVPTKWRTLRRIMNTYIFSASRLDGNQQLRSKKVEDLIAYCEQSRQTGEAVDIGRAAFRTSMNFLSNVIFSKDLADPLSDSAKEFKNVVWDVMVEATRPNLVDFFPVLRKLDPQSVRRRMAVHYTKIFEIMRALISERVESKKSGGSNIDVLDDLLSLCKETPEEVDRDLIEHLFLDMFIAGTDTTSNTVEWGMAQLLKNPKVLKKAQAELEEVIGRGKKLEESDIARLPYLQCVVKETMRLHPAVPFLIRKVEKDVKIFDYILPGGSRVLVNVWAIGRDETAWEDASVFKPERFVGSDIDIRGRDFDLIPFGAGRRTCPGLSLAVRAVPVMIGSLINMFDWKLEGGIKREELDLDEKFGITLQKARPLRAVPVGLKI